MNYCPECGTELRDSVQYCPDCGASVGRRDEQDAHEETPQSSSASEERVVPKQETSKGGVFVGALGSSGIIVAHFMASRIEGLAGTVSLLITLFAVLLLVSLLDDYFEFGLLGSWEPRKTRLIGMVGVSSFLFSVLIFVGANTEVGGAAILRLLSSVVLLLFSGAIGVWRFGFRKKVGAK